MKKSRSVPIAAALLLTASMVMTGCDGMGRGQTEGENGEQQGISPEAGKITAYDADAADFTLEIDAADEVHEISDLLYGIFIEDINFAADGGLYAEMVQNRSFEFTNLAAGNQKHAWADVGEVTAEVTIGDEVGGLNCNNTNYMVIQNTSGEPAGVANSGFLDGMSITEGASYDFSIYAKGLEGYNGPIHVELKVGDEVAGSGTIEAVNAEWQKYELTLTASETADTKVTLAVTIDQGSAAIDMVSLFPQDTFKARKNGLRKDLAEKLEALQPSFLRFPGGCVVEGYTLSDAYDWKDSIGVDENGEPLLFNGTYGDVAARKMGQDIWTNINTHNDPYPSFMTYGLGFYEYFLLAEDIGAIGVPVVNCGMACTVRGGNVAAINSEEMEGYIQDALDLVEFCRGGADTKWGAVRIAMGHEEPFELKYIGIGNEQWGENFYRHYEAFVEAFAAAKEADPELYGDVELMFTAGTDDGDSGHSMYIAAYERAEQWLEANPDKELSDYAGAIDHHYYNTPDWFLSHTDYYDEENYTRSEEGFSDSLYGGGLPVFVGEFAAQSNTWNAALAEAAYMTGLERNGDIVVMAAYAPLFGNLTATHWAPDLIWFNNHLSTSSVNYYVQQIFSLNAGTELIASRLTGEQQEAEALQGKIGLATWNTAAVFDNVKVVDNESGEVLAEDDFSESRLGTEWEMVSDGIWNVEDGVLKQEAGTTNTANYANTGSAVYFGDDSWTDYTFTVEAAKTSGEEGFLIPFAVESMSDNYFWNIGGWGNTVSCLQQVSNGTKSDQIAGTVKNCVINTGQTYEIKIVVSDNNVKCYLDDELYVDYDVEPTRASKVYQVVSTDDSGDIIIKMVNVSSEPQTVAVDLQNAESVEAEAERYVVAGSSPSDDNILGKEEVVTMETDRISGVTGQFNYTLPEYSVTVLRIKAGKR